MRRGLLLLLLIALSFCCSPKKSEKAENSGFSSFTFFTMDTVVEVQYRGEEPEVEGMVKREFERLYAKYSPSLSTSATSRINRGAGAAMELDGESAYLLSQALLYSRLSEGRFDVTVKPLVDLWGFQGKSGDRPPPGRERVQETLKRVSYKRVLLEGRRLFLPEGMGIDLGGIAKGYAVDRARDLFRRAGVKDFLINAGGDLWAEGKNPRGEPWRVGIQNPRGEGILRVLSLSGKAVATSGDYQRFFLWEGRRYHHLLSPFTGYPFPFWTSMTVEAESCIKADALATAFSGVESGRVKALLDKLPGVRLYALRPDLSFEDDL
ncbi:MAG TPA: FAD:protein FMN transferase [Candidatus Aminicenantes bacterium]|nr:FAD:protein FMN transferase [Candidatus Aminicenantes bacterium]